MRASVVIAVRDDADGLRATLDALARQTLAPDDFEVLVVDDASTDGTAAVAEGRAGVRLLRQDVGRGSYVARNRALREARGAVIAVTDAGCVPAPDWLERGVERLDRDDAVLAGHIAMPLGADAPIAAMVDVIHHLDQERYVTRSGFAVTANLLARLATFDRIGPFDETLRSGGDAEWTSRAKRAGVPLVYAREVVVVHPPRRTAAALLAKSRRVAVGGSSLRRAGAGPPARRPYLQRDVLLPRHRARGRARVHEEGAAPGRMRWAAVGVAQVAFVQLPQAWHALRADLRATLGRT